MIKEIKISRIYARNMYEELFPFTRIEKKKGKKMENKNLPILYDLIKKRKYYPNWVKMLKWMCTLRSFWMCPCQMLQQVNTT